MGNCLIGSMTNAERIQVVSGNGGIMEFNGPLTAGVILEEFPCHAIVNGDDLLWTPLSNHQELHPGLPYLLLPLHTDKYAFQEKVGHVRSKSIPTSRGAVPPFRMSFDRRQNVALKRSNTDVLSRHKKGGGVWKVKLAISSEQLLEIFSEEVRTQELIESVRTVAKCGSSGASSVSFSDQWSTTTASSWTYSKKG
ncbi:uncharacterized protein LOC141653708 [Silene latifolia]|uniref:uncharacterized protein LOC141653708 n=1 Tax=Silene latifolia TaxID=37657 RepID=UPI003D7716A6